MSEFKKDLINFLQMCTNVLNSEGYTDIEKAKVKLSMGQMGVGIALSAQVEEFKAIYREVKEQFPVIVHMGKLKED